MEDTRRIPQPPEWNPSAVPSIAPKPPQRYTMGEVPSFEGAAKRVTGVNLPLADLSRGSGSLVNNAVVLASSPLLQGLVRPTYAENEMVPAGLSPSGQDEASRVLAQEAAAGGNLKALLDRPRGDSANQIRDMRALLYRQQP